MIDGREEEFRRMESRADLRARELADGVASAWIQRREAGLENDLVSRKPGVAGVIALNARRLEQYMWLIDPSRPKPDGPMFQAVGVNNGLHYYTFHFPEGAFKAGDLNEDDVLVPTEKRILLMMAARTDETGNQPPISEPASPTMVLYDGEAITMVSVAGDFWQNPDALDALDFVDGPAV